MTLANALYDELNRAGVETVLDDRNERPTVKFKDADLIGYPLKITIGPKTVNENIVETKLRSTGEVRLLARENCISEIKNILFG